MKTISFLVDLALIAAAVTLAVTVANATTDIPSEVRPPRPAKVRRVCGPVECAPVIDVTCGSDTAGIIAACAEAGAAAAADAVANVTCPAAPACVCPAAPACPEVRVVPACAKYKKAGGVARCVKWVVPVVDIKKTIGLRPVTN